MLDGIDAAYDPDGGNGELGGVVGGSEGWETEALSFRPPLAGPKEAITSSLVPGRRKVLIWYQRTKCF